MGERTVTQFASHFWELPCLIKEVSYPDRSPMADISHCMPPAGNIPASGALLSCPAPATPSVELLHDDLPARHTRIFWRVRPAYRDASVHEVEKGCLSNLHPISSDDQQRRVLSSRFVMWQPTEDSAIPLSIDYFSYILRNSTVECADTRRAGRTEHGFQERGQAPERRTQQPGTRISGGLQARGLPHLLQPR